MGVVDTLRQFLVQKASVLQKCPVSAKSANHLIHFHFTDYQYVPILILAFVSPTQWILVTLVHFNFVLARIRDAKSGQFSP